MKIMHNGFGGHAARLGPFLLSASFLLLPLVGCSSAGRPSTAAAAGARDAGADTDPALVRALDATLARRGPTRDLEMATECTRDDGFRTAAVYGNGVGIWNREVQFLLPPGEVRGLLEGFREVGFPNFPASFGEAGEEGEEEGGDGGAVAIRVVCLVRLHLEGIDKQVVQYDTGPQSTGLARLAGRILDTARRAGASGVGADDLGDGLAKVAGGELAPETLRLQLHWKGSREGCLLRLAGGVAEARRFTAGAGYGPPHRLRPSPAEVSDLARSLQLDGVEGFPQNLYAADYEDLSVAVLRHEKDVQARPFAGMTPSTHGAAQDGFDRVVGELRDLCDRVLQQGGEVAGPAADEGNGK